MIGSGTRGVVYSARRRQRNQPRTQTKVHSVSWFAASAHVTRFRSTRGGKLAQFWSVLRDVERTGCTCCQLVDHCLAFFCLPACCWRCWSELVLSPRRMRTTVRVRQSGLARGVRPLQLELRKLQPFSGNVRRSLLKMQRLLVE